MFASLATQETLLRMQILCPWRTKMFFNQVRNIFAFKQATQETSQGTIFQQQCFLV